MRCRNCGQVERFVLLVELAVVAQRKSEQSDSCRAVPEVEGPAPDADWDSTDHDWDSTDHDWNLSLACDACASTDVVGDPARLLTACGG